MTHHKKVYSDPSEAHECAMRWQLRGYVSILIHPETVDAGRRYVVTAVER